MSASDKTNITIIERDDRKSVRKQKRAYHRLFRDMNIKCTEHPTQHLMICNGGLVTGIKRETLQCVLDPLISKYTLTMPTGKTYCFVTCNSKEDATCVYNYIHGRIKLPGQNGPLYVCYTERVPITDYFVSDSAFPPGLTLIENFITEEQEKMLLETVDWDKCKNVIDLQSISWDQYGTVWSQLKYRDVKHFGYEFEYGTNLVNPDKPIVPIPQEYKFLQTLFDKHGHKYTYDQLTVNRYLPGQGIPPHIDTHSVFEDTILSLSLGSMCIMNFIKEDKRIEILLPTRSLLIMTGEARYAWKHSISPRYDDVIKTENGPTTQERGIRVSFTFRKVRRGECYCDFKDYCDTARREIFIDDKMASGLENSYVHKVYEEISNHFSETRCKRWPCVTKFLKSLEKGTLLLDVGCGNGKYLNGNQNVFKMGCDYNSGLIDICRKRNFEVIQCNCLYLPYKDDSVDAAISIAVIHHLSSDERRLRAISEIVRVLRPKGRCLIYVWAMEQHRNSKDSLYVKSGKKSKESENINESEINYEKISECNITLPIHKNRTVFPRSDMLVPWTKKSGERFLRYYHVFRDGELVKLCTKIPSVSIKQVYYDEGNWCVILEKCVERL
ncbi:PREDICTED: alkylated DNA repair protein alkB homolog 8 [Cyphomyrmex costatus]|uniref:Alkylated DNA repair protein alkB like protein 8 n=1 Tax=Cyphomyrmex costatus TaxID=456900 RepID=A0A195C626_9HYME|nr:PREDICTED: alkylated DNA repair protein alkB homolog 8 [Cyphomyrmex costatus]XP_018403245.1 PREDICTED: alkylated DNA repair protein alkB homolog 8 [Cyphomyrmex costatus]KYM95618.1 Alkylated DNA repair protein alkB like protein 8 [Cyphomyrmex costatus]